MMKISLDQPALVSLPATDNTPPLPDALSGDFLNFLSQLLTPAPVLPEVIEGTENQTAVTDMTDKISDDLNNLLIGMNYLAQGSPTIPTPVVNTDNKTEIPSPVMPSTSTSMPETGSIIDPTNRPTVAPVGQQTNQTPILLQKTQPTREQKPNHVKNQPLTPIINKPMVNKMVNKINNMKQALRTTTSDTLALNTTELTQKVTASPELAMPETALNQKAAQGLNQLAEWLQGKINASPELLATLPQTKSEVKAATLDALTTMNTAGAATPAKAAFEAKVEMAEIRNATNNLDINLAHYQANIKIYPPELGKVSAKLKMDKNTATLSVIAETKEVKALIESHLPSLREQFAGSNIQLNKIEVTLAEPKAHTNTSTDAGGRRESKQEKPEAGTRFEEQFTQKTVKSKAKQTDNAVDAYV